MQIKDKKSREQIDWSFFRDIPIWDVIEVLGLEADRKNGLFTCPAHNDSHPSAKVYEEENNWHCFVCKTSGTTIDLVMHANGCNTLDAIHFLNSYFPGGIKEEELEPGMPSTPIIDAKILQTIGLKRNPFAMISINDSLLKTRVQMEISKVDATMLILSKIDAYIEKVANFTVNVYTTFPNFEKNPEAIREINYRTMEMIDSIREYVPVLENYLIELGTSRRLEEAKLEEIPTEKNSFSKHMNAVIPGRQRTDTIEHPKLSEEFLKTLGLTGDPYQLIRTQCRGKRGLEDVANKWDVFDNTPLTAEETTTLLLNRIHLYKQKWINYEKILYRLYPGLQNNKKAKSEIRRVIDEKNAKVSQEEKALETYWRTLNENLSKTDPTAFYPDDINIEELL